MKEKRRPKGEGSITKLPNGKLKMTLTLGVGADGKQKRKAVTASNKAELMQKVTELRVAMGQPRETKMYMKELMDIYMNYKNEEFRLNTKIGYDFVIKKVVEPLYDFRIDKVTPELIDNVLDKARKRNGEPLSPHSIRTLKSKLSAIFNFAVSRGLINKSPMKQTKKRKKVSEKVDRILIPTKEEMKEILAYTKERDEHCDSKVIKLYPLFLLAVASGMRIGELLDIDRVRDIDVKYHSISINTQSTRGGHDQPLKTPTSRRTIYIQPDILNMILETIPKSSKTTKLWHYNDLPLSYTTINTILATFFKNNPKTPNGFSFHCFRHYHATQLLLKGINIKEVSKRLGHARIQTTLDLYAHWIPEMDRSASEVIGIDMIL